MVLDGVRTQDFANIADKLGTNLPLRIVLIGRISPWKGQHIFIKAAAIVKNKMPGKARFEIAGSAMFGEQDYEAEIHSLVEELALEESGPLPRLRERHPKTN